MNLRELDYILYAEVMGREVKCIGLIDPQGKKPYGEMYANWAKLPHYSDDIDLLREAVVKLRDEIKTQRADFVKIMNKVTELKSCAPEIK